MDSFQGKAKMIRTTCSRLVKNNARPSSRKYPQRSDRPYNENRLNPPNSPFCLIANDRGIWHTPQHTQSPMRSHGLFDLSCWWASMCCKTEGKWTQREALHRSQNFEPEIFFRLTLTKITISIFLMSTSETIETKIHTSVRYLIFH